jgi:hypothetical protein
MEAKQIARDVINDLHRGGTKVTERHYAEAEKIAEAVESLCSLLNTYTQETEMKATVFVRCLCGQHRSLQQAFWRLMREVIARYANEHHDLRNEASVQWCKRVAAEVDAYLPFV